MEHESRGSQSPVRSGQGKRVLAVRAMANEIAWLHGVPVWQSDRVVWETAHGLVFPDPATVALARRRLRQIGRYRRAAAIVLGDAEAWLARSEERLYLAAWLLQVGRHDLDDVIEGARPGERGNLRACACLIVVEALCPDGLARSPSLAMLRSGERALPVLREMIEDAAVPAAGRVLAACIAGCMQREIGQTAPALRGETLAALPGMGRVYRRAIAQGVRGDLALYAAVAALPDGDTQVERLDCALSMARHCTLPTAYLRRGLWQGVAAGTLADMAEAMGEIDSAARRALHYRDDLLALPSGTRTAMPAAESQARARQAAAMRARRLAHLAELHTIVLDYARRTGEARVLQALAGFLHHMLDLAPAVGPEVRVKKGRARKVEKEPGAPAPEVHLATDHLLSTALIALRQGLRLPTARLLDYATCLDDQFDVIWPLTTLTPSTLPDGERDRLVRWLERRHGAALKPAITLLERGADRQVIAEAIFLDVAEDLAAWSYPDPRLYGRAVALLREHRLSGNGPDASWRKRRWLLELIGACASTAAAHALLSPFFKAVHAFPTELQGMVLEVAARTVRTVEEVAAFSAAAALVLPAVVRPDWTSLALGDVLTAMFAGARALARVADAERWFGWLVTLPSEPGGIQAWSDDRWVASCDILVRIAVELAMGDRRVFEATVTAFSRLVACDECTSVDHSVVEMLRRYPGLSRLLRATVVRWPKRSLELLVRLGRLPVLSDGCDGPFADLAEIWAAPEAYLPEDWGPVLELAPETAPTAHFYLQVMRITGRSARLPRGVRQALALPARLASEAEYLQRHLDQRPELARRLAGCQARLADTAGLQRAIAGEIQDRLEEAAWQQALLAAESVVNAYFAARVSRLTGCRPQELSDAVDPLLLHAVELESDLQSNRKLLRRLLRAWGNGEPDHFTRHPANRVFLAGLAARGVDADVWLSERRVEIACPAIPGGRIVVHFERNPLRILEMGSLFGTCLGAHQFNAHAAVANACELNKRVVFAYDPAGKPLGRKLIGIGAEGSLIGYRTYTTNAGDAASAVCAAITAQIRLFARQCGLCLADDGTVPALFAEDWYDDGAVPWDEDLTHSGVSPSGTVLDGPSISEAMHIAQPADENVEAGRASTG